MIGLLELTNGLRCGVIPAGDLLHSPKHGRRIIVDQHQVGPHGAKRPVAPLLPLPSLVDCEPEYRGKSILGKLGLGADRPHVLAIAHGEARIHVPAEMASSLRYTCFT